MKKFVASSAIALLVLILINVASAYLYTRADLTELSLIHI